MLEIAVCDEEREELERILNMLHEICTEIKQECHISAYQSPDDMLNRHHKIDIGVLDVVMPSCDGIDLGRKLKEKFPEIALIYITSYEDYYKQVINKVHAFAFLAKPVNKPELKEQIAECVLELPSKRVDIELLFKNVRNSSGEELESVRLKVEDILYCEYVKTKREIAVALQDEVYYYKEVFEKLSERMGIYGFAMNCRGSIVNLRHIRRLKGYTIYLDNGEELQLTQKRVAEFKRRMNSYIQKS